MKLKYVGIIYTVVTVLALIFSIITLSGVRNSEIDLSDVYLISEHVISGIEAGEDFVHLEKMNNCQILLKSNQNYYSLLAIATKDNKVVIDYEKDNVLIGKIVFDGARRFYDKEIVHSCYRVGGFLLFSLFMVYVILFIIYNSYSKPFKKLESFADSVAKGNLDVQLPMTKNNYFGKFTESFDIMREELILSKERENEANRSKKELVAELSHDMKTPIATIKATVELLIAKFQLELPDSKQKQDYIDKLEVVNTKADMIEQLISNMFHATLEELHNLAVEPIETSSQDLARILMDTQCDERIKLVSAIPECLVLTDKLRFRQVVDNVVNNSIKYAGTTIEISSTLENEYLVIEIRDFGPGVLVDELPYVTEKFYRGSNHTGQNGSGLGLYLSKYFMENMGGGIDCKNDQGFVIHLYLKKA